MDIENHYHLHRYPSCQYCHMTTIRLEKHNDIFHPSQQSFAILFAHPRIPISHAYNVVKSPMQPLMKTFWSFKFWGVFLTTLLQGFGY